MRVTTQSTAIALALASLAVAAPSCKSVCDDDGLRRTAVAFEERSSDLRAAGFATLWQACPSMPLGLARSLAAEFDPAHELEGDALERHHAERSEDPQWRTLLHRTCPGVTHDPFDLADPGALRDACTLERHALLRADDVFVPRDATALVLYDWLLSVRVPLPLAQDVVRPLLAVSATAEELEAMCWSESVACEHVVASWGLSLPDSSLGRSLPGEGPRILVARDRLTLLTLQGAPVLSLHDGRLASADRIGRAIPLLRERLTPLVPPESDTELERPDASIVLVADRATPFGTLVEVLFTATKAGFPSASLFVRRDHALRSLAVVAPETWLPPTNVVHDRASEFRLVVRHDGVSTVGPTTDPRTIPNLEPCDPSPRGCHDLQAVASVAAGYAKQHPRELGLSLGVEDELPLQAVLAILDAVNRGYGCEGPTAPPGCEYLFIRLDGAPQLYEHSDRVGTLVLGDARVERWASRVVSSETERTALAAYAPAREAIGRCMTDRPDVIGRWPDTGTLRVQYLQPSRGKGPMSGHLWLLANDHGTEIERCVLDSLGVEPDEGTSFRDFLERLRFELVIPTRFEPPP
ncbi:ExbD/TolR family protein [Paraliomyxa miuraensis]|uniref:ExbD/TolR family protein n=1 Tax=Paraliomyxa miuraensis TaxID=376150 RepID=UPI002258ADFD|nr:hypothetical protein [Paraliomyxa miuraensis]MCX4246358.1 hypothetical protein [Paraliomyxa miuraensis]